MATDPILDALLGTLPDGWDVEGVTIGANWTIATVVEPSGERHAGLAASFGSADNNTPTHLVPGQLGPGAVEIPATQASDLARQVYAEDPGAAAIGFATLNSLLQPPLDSLEDVDAADWLIVNGRDKKVALVGHFPFIDELRPAVKDLSVLELTPGPGEHPASHAPDIIPHADVVAITASTLINHTLGGLLLLARPGAKVMLLGPTTPLSPVLFDYGIHLLSGVRVVDIDAAVDGVTRGLIFRHIQGLRRVTFQSKGLP